MVIFQFTSFFLYLLLKFYQKQNFSGSFIFKKILFISLFLAALGLRCCAGFSLVVVMVGGLLFIVMHGLFIAVASFTTEHGLWGVQTSVVAVYGLRSFSSRALEHRLSSCGTWA